MTDFPDPRLYQLAIEQTRDYALFLLAPDAFTPTLGFATQVVSVTVLIFFGLIGFVFWLASLHDRPDFRQGAVDSPHGALRAADAAEAERTA